RPAFEAWAKERGPVKEIPGVVARFPLGSADGGKVANAADPAKPGRPHEGPKFATRSGRACAELDGENGFTFPGVGHFHRADALTLAIAVRPPERHAPRAVVVHHSRAPIDAGSRGYELLLEDGRVAFGLHHMWPANSLKVRTKAAILPGARTHLTATYDGTSKAAGSRIYLDAK